MGVDKPYFRTFRMFADGNYTSSGSPSYVEHPSFAKSPENYIYASQLIIDDLKELFEYVEPSDTNLDTYSYRIHSLFVRTCIEIEANFKAILLENGYCKNARRNLNICDYKKLESTHFLSNFAAIFPHWNGERSKRYPFKDFEKGKSPEWYSSYNAVKHDRKETFIKANLLNLTDSIAALAVILAAQFGSNNFVKGSVVLSLYSNDPYEASPTGYLRMEYPKSIPEESRYCFDWEQLKNSPAPFQKLSFS